MAGGVAMGAYVGRTEFPLYRIERITIFPEGGKRGKWAQPQRELTLPTEKGTVCDGAKTK